MWEAGSLSHGETGLADPGARITKSPDWFNADLTDERGGGMRVFVHTPVWMYVNTTHVFTGISKQDAVPTTQTQWKRVRSKLVSILASAWPSALDMAHFVAELCPSLPAAITGLAPPAMI